MSARLSTRLSNRGTPRRRRLRGHLHDECGWYGARRSRNHDIARICSRNPSRAQLRSRPIDDPRFTRPISLVRKRRELVRHLQTASWKKLLVFSASNQSRADRAKALTFGQVDDRLRVEHYTGNYRQNVERHDTGSTDALNQFPRKTQRGSWHQPRPKAHARPPCSADYPQASCLHRVPRRSSHQTWSNKA